MPKLFTPLSVGALALEHRVVMAPLTRMRANSDDSPSPLMREYYQQRASAGGLIISEATPVSRNGYGFAGAPGIYDDRQIDGWKAITDAVHERGGSMLLQLWHVGRKSHPALQPNGEQPVGPSAIQAEGSAITRDGPIAFSLPRALEQHEIPGIVAQYGAGAARAKAAGFDGVEIHGANGYLPEQFLLDGTNQRNDDYGGTIANRARFLLEITRAAADVFGADRVGVRLSPEGASDSDPRATYGYVASALDAMGIAYIHLIVPFDKEAEPGAAPAADKKPIPESIRHLRALFSGVVFVSGGFDKQSAQAALAAGEADAVAFGRAFIANPDLPERLRLGRPLNAYDRSTFYGGGARGYTDYPAFNQADGRRQYQDNPA
ncbi:alkene reductase [Sphingomonas fennica]|uniref:Alkene reductase n=1 Tax=Edaphosphingomonas fennica TaxID=114404 RepID=A0A2T4HLZ5_9SPHN|nr:alkene reductase [Sphingomonas fennica]PTD16797.1 alkene reductase [Sphingomonas fennica]